MTKTLREAQEQEISQIQGERVMLSFCTSLSHDKDVRELDREWRDALELAELDDYRCAPGWWIRDEVANVAGLSRYPGTRYRLRSWNKCH